MWARGVPTQTLSVSPPAPGGSSASGCVSRPRERTSVPCHADVAAGMQGDLPLAYGVPSASTGFLKKLEQEKAGPSGAAPAPAEDLVARRRRADSQSLGDFISFDELSYEAPAAEPAEPTRRPAAQRAELWSTARHYDGPSALLRLHEELLDFAHAFKPTRAETTARSDLVSRVRDVVSSVWPAAEIRCFGSYDTRSTCLRCLGGIARSSLAEIG